MLTIRVPISGVLISLALLFVLTVPGSNSASAQTTQTPQAYITWWCYCPGPACDAFCPNLNATSVVSSLTQTDGPNDYAPTCSPDATQLPFPRTTTIHPLPPL